MTAIAGRAGALHARLQVVEQELGGLCAGVGLQQPTSSSSYSSSPISAPMKTWRSLLPVAQPPRSPGLAIRRIGRPRLVNRRGDVAAATSARRPGPARRGGAGAVAWRPRSAPADRRAARGRGVALHRRSARRRDAAVVAEEELADVGVEPVELAALPSTPRAAGAGAGAEDARRTSGDDAGAGFFLKKLNMAERANREDRGARDAARSSRPAEIAPDRLAILAGSGALAQSVRATES